MHLHMMSFPSFYQSFFCFVELWLCVVRLQRVNIWESIFAELEAISQFYRIAKGRHIVE